MTNPTPAAAPGNAASPSYTPRTDKAEIAANQVSPFGTTVVHSRICRQLEMELAAVTAERDAARALNGLAICAYCQCEVEKNTDAMMTHMDTCEKHPVGAILRDYEILKDTLKRCEVEFGNVARDADAQISGLKTELQSVAGPPADAVAKDLDHYGCRHSRWWKSVEKARETILTLP